jgi:hypothetical protein
MESKPKLELATLPTRHPEVGLAFLRQCGTAAVLRLSIDPFRMPGDAKAREIIIDRVTRGRPEASTVENREIGWSGLDGATDEDCIRLNRAFNERRITEDAAIAVMALLIDELEGMTVEAVLQIGSGPDYFLRLKGKRSHLPVEVSGIREDASGGKSSSRLGEKRQQVLKKNAAGFVSVTTFSHLQTKSLHSYLHYVMKPSAGKKRGNKDRRNGRKRK